MKLLEARLSAEYFDVTTASSGAEALAICERAECDIVLLDVMMPDLDGFEVCRRLKSNPATHHIPVVMVTALDQPSDASCWPGGGRRRFPDQAGFRRRAHRTRALTTRLKMMTDELRMRAAASREIGIESAEREAITEEGGRAAFCIVDDRRSSYERLAAMLGKEHIVDIEPDPSAALFRSAEELRAPHRARSVSKASMGCACAASCVRSTAPAIFRSCDLRAG